MTTARQGFLLILVSAGGYSTASIFAKIAYANGADTVTVLAGRFTIAAVLLWAYLYLTGSRAAISRRDAVGMAAMGALGNVAVSMLYFSGLNLLPLTVFVILSYTYPAFVTILSFFFLGEPLSTPKLVSLLLTTVGCGVMFWSGDLTFNPFGVALTLGAALAYSIYIVCLSKAFGHIDPKTTMTYTNSASAVCFLLYGFGAGAIKWQTAPAGWAAILAMAVLATAVASIAFFSGVRLIGPSRAALTSTIEPVYTVILGILILRERLTFNQVLGGILVITALILLQRGEPRPAGKELSEGSEE